MKNLFKTFAVFIIVAIMQYTVFTLFYCTFEQTISLLPFTSEDFALAYTVVYLILIIITFSYLGSKGNDYYK